MKVIETNILDVKIIEPQIYFDERGFFFESFNQDKFHSATGISVDFVQDNHSKSSMGVLRGLHYQLEPSAQAKLVRCISGAIFDVAVDIRKSSPTFGKWVGVELSSENKRQIWIPEGFAHGFLTLTDNTEIVYKTNNYYDSKLERSIIWDDAILNIQWPKTENIIISDKDTQGKKINEAELFT